MMKLVEMAMNQGHKDEFVALDDTITDANVKAALTAQAEQREKAAQAALQREIIEVFDTMESHLRYQVEQIRAFRKKEAKLKRNIELINEAIALAKQGNFMPALTMLGCTYPIQENPETADTFKTLVAEKFREVRI